MKTCPNCERPFRTGAKVLLVIGRETKRAIVCGDCAKLAVQLLLHGEHAGSCDACGERRAKFCSGCVGDMLKQQAAADRIAIAQRAREVLGGDE